MYIIKSYGKPRWCVPDKYMIKYVNPDSVINIKNFVLYTF
jgi:hypothetical protein